MKKNKPSQGRDEKKVALYRHVENVRRRIVRGMNKSLSRGLEVVNGRYFDPDYPYNTQGAACALSLAAFAKVGIVDVEDARPALFGKTVTKNGADKNQKECPAHKVLGDVLDLTPLEVNAIITGFDLGDIEEQPYVTRKEKALHRLGTRLFQEYAR